MESKKNSASLITYRFFDFDNSRVCIGGIETYTYDLSQLLISEGYDVTVCILTPENRLMQSVEYRGITIKEMHRPKGKNNKKDPEWILPGFSAPLRRKFPRIIIMEITVK